MPQPIQEKSEPIKQEPSRSWWGWGRKKSSRETTPAPEPPITAELTKEKPPVVIQESILDDVDEPSGVSVQESEEVDLRQDDSPKSNSEKCRKSLRLSSEQIVSHEFLMSYVKLSDVHPR